MALVYSVVQYSFNESPFDDVMVNMPLHLNALISNFIDFEVITQNCASHTNVSIII